LEGGGQQGHIVAGQCVVAPDIGPADHDESGFMEDAEVV
jgi:hypothetical protein